MMSDPAPDDALFDFEVFDLRPRGDAATVPRRSAASPFARPRVSRLSKAFRSGALALTLLAGMLALLSPILFSATLGSSTPTAALHPPVSQWASLEARPVRLPALQGRAGCPVGSATPVPGAADAGLGEGPVVLVGPGTDRGELIFDQVTVRNAAGISVAAGSEQQVLWYVQPGYEGPMLIRGEQLDGRQVLGFTGGLGLNAGGDGLSMQRDLRIVANALLGTPWQSWRAGVVVPGTGCYAVQVDGVDIHEIIVFHAVAAQRQA
jgi:hypothetical protein